MSNTNTGGPAFPLPCHTKRWDDIEKRYSQDEGMTLRDYFAAKAGEKDIEPYWVAPLNREQAKYKYADAMLKARNT